MRVALIGGSGFIGLAAAEAIAKSGGRPVICDTAERLARNAADLSRFETATIDGTPEIAALAVEGVDAAVLLTWGSHPASSMQSIVDDARISVLTALTAVATVAAAGAGRLVFISSGGTVYGKVSRIPVDEDHPADPISAYGVGKLTIEKYLPLFSRTSALSGVSLRVSNPCGPYQLRGTPVGVIARFIRAVRDGQPIEVFGDGSIIRDYIDVRDAAAAIALAVDPSRVPDGVYNVGAGEGRSLNEVIAAVSRASGIEPNVLRRQGRPFDVPAIVLSFERLHAACGWRPRIPFEDTVRLLWEAAVSPNVRAQ